MTFVRRAPSRWLAAAILVGLGAMLSWGDGAAAATGVATANSPTSGSGMHLAGWATESQLDAFVAQQRDDYGLSGLSVVVIEQGAVAFERSYGDAKPGGPEVTSATPFVLGSTSKQFTGLAVQQLIAQGSLSLDDTVGMLLPALGGADSTYADVTVSQLLTHTSGISYVTGNEQWDPLATVTSVQGEARIILQSSPISTPGSQYEYSNANYTLLGAIVETLTGQTYQDALHTLVTGPLGLDSTTADFAEAGRSGVAAGHYRWFGAIDSTTPGPAWPMSAPSAYISSSAHDLTRLVQAQLGAPSGIAASTLAADRAPLTRLNEYSQYGSGWFIRPFWEMHDSDENGDDPTLPQLWEHDGDAQRSMSYVSFSPDIGFGVVVLTNSGLGMDRDRWSRFTYSLLHEIVGTTPSPAAVDPLVAAAPVILIVLPVVLLLTLVWLCIVLRRRPRSRLARWTPMVVGVVMAGATISLAFAFVPSRTFTPLFDRGWWTGAPDFSVSVGVSLLFALGIVVALAVTLVSGRRGRRH